ncbi:MAG: T9SS type A sorting domain-containing protein, partial [Flavobacteriales bacterium]
AYRFALDSGSYVVSPTLTAPLWVLSSDSASYQVDFTGNDTLVDHLDFGFVPGPTVTDVVVAFTSDPNRCGWTIHQYIDLANIGNTIVQGQLVVHLDPLITFDGSVPAPTTVNGQTITWDIDSIPYLSSLPIELTCTLPGALFIGDSMHTTIELTAVDSLGATVGTFQTTWASIVSCAYDPNDKQVTPAGFGGLGAVDISTEEFDYTVRFQNTGTDTAFTVIIRDQLPAEVDEASIRLIGASHTLTDMRVEPDREAVFTFSGIMLPDSNVDELGSHGYVRFRIALNNGLPSGTTVQNNAGIYFDLNVPVTTNTVLTTLVDCSLFTSSVVQTSPSTLLASAGINYQWFLDGTAISGATTQELVTYFTGSYAVSVTSNYGCVALSAPFSYISNSTNELSTIQCAVMPNPFSEQTLVQFNEPLTPQHGIQLIDTHGRLVRQLIGEGRNTLILERGNLAAGLYLLRVTLQGNTVGYQRIALEE